MTWQLHREASEKYRSSRECIAEGWERENPSRFASQWLRRHWKIPNIPIRIQYQSLALRLVYLQRSNLGSQTSSPQLARCRIALSSSYSFSSSTTSIIINSKLPECSSCTFHFQRASSQQSIERIFKFFVNFPISSFLLAFCCICDFLSSGRQHSRLSSGINFLSSPPFYLSLSFQIPEASTSTQPNYCVYFSALLERFSLQS